MRNALYFGMLLVISFGCAVVLGLLDDDGRGFPSLFSLDNLAGFAIYTPVFLLVLVALHGLERRLTRPRFLGALALLGVMIAVFLIAFADRITPSAVGVLLGLGGVAALFLWAAERVPALLLRVNGGPRSRDA